jgi:UDP-2,3-diacylglucosamine pyrophosphatase LpxH
MPRLGNDDMAAPSDALIVGDLHLRTGSDPAGAADFARLVSSAAGPGARLVLAGDIFDLDWVGSAPRAGEGPAAAAGRLRGILAEFPDVTVALRGFLAGGGEVEWLAGNHDAEILHPEVQRVLQQALGDPGEKLRFFPEGVDLGGVRVEHGHQHDPDNRFLPDTRAAVLRGRLADFPLGCLLTRFLLSRLPYYRERGDQHRTPWDTFRGVLRDFGWRTPWMVLLYFVSGVRIARLAGGPLARAQAVTMKSARSVARRMYLDRMALGAVLVVWLALALLLPAAGAERLWLLMPGLALGAALIIPPARRHEYFERARRESTAAARGLLSGGFREVVLGHTHRAGEEALPEGRVVFLGAFQFAGPRGRPFARVRAGRAELDWLPPMG